MGTKMKGLLKGLRYISQIFDDEKEQEIQIGNPTDVKHVAHIGWDGPSVESPSWMNDFKSPTDVQSGPLENTGDSKGVSEDSHKSRASDSSLGDVPEVVVKSTRRHHSSSGEKTDSPRKDSRRHSRRNHSKESGENSVKSGRQSLDSATTTGLESPSRNIPDIPKKSRRKKSKENFSGLTGVSSKPVRSKDTTGGGSGSVKTRTKEVSPASSMKNPIQEEEEGVGSSDVSWTS